MCIMYNRKPRHLRKTDLSSTLRHLLNRRRRQNLVSSENLMIHHRMTHGSLNKPSNVRFLVGHLRNQVMGACACESLPIVPNE